MILPVTYNDYVMLPEDAWDLTLNWKDNNGGTILLSTYEAVLTFYNGNEIVYQITSPEVDGEGITLSNTLPNIVAVIPKTNTVISPKPIYFILELTPAGGQTFQLLKGAIKYGRRTQ